VVKFGGESKFHSHINRKEPSMSTDGKWTCSICSVVPANYCQAKHKWSWNNRTINDYTLGTRPGKYSHAFTIKNMHQCLINEVSKLFRLFINFNWEYFSSQQTSCGKLSRYLHRFFPQEDYVQHGEASSRVFFFEDKAVAKV